MSYLRQGRFEIIAHRGGGLEAPENTLAAFRHAAEIYPDSVFELDVHRTQDGEIVVFHDDLLERVTDGRGVIWQTPFKELRKLDAAYNFSKDGGRTYPWRGKGEKIPLLSEVLEMFPRNRVSIEFKHPLPFFGDRVIEIIRSAKANDRVVLAGDHHANLARVAALAPEMCSGFSRREIIGTLVWGTLGIKNLCPKRAQVLQIPFRHNGIPVASRRFISGAHERGLYVHVWTVNDEVIMRQLIDWGADGIVTDAPSLLLRVARDLKKV